MMIRPLVFSLILLFSTAIARAEMFIRERAEEADKLQAAQGIAERADSAIILRLADGTTITRRNENQCGDDGSAPDYAHCFSYVFIGHLTDHHAFLLGLMYQEDYFYEWIDDRTGETAHIWCEPHFSPSGVRLVAVCPEELGYNGIQVWAHQGEKLVKEWEYKPQAYALYEFRGWDGEDVVNLAMTTYVDHKITENLPARLARSPEWTIQGPSEQSR